MASLTAVKEYPLLRRPPLREALINLGLAEELPESFVEILKNENLVGFSSVQPILRGQVSVEIKAEGSSTAIVKNSEVEGWRYATGDDARIVALRRSGLTYSVLRGYTNWAEIRASAQQVWQHYCKWAGPVRVGRLAVRYVNVLELPLGGIDFDRYLTAGPRIPAQMPQTLSGFLQRVVVPFGNLEASATVTQALESPTETHLPLVLDIEVGSGHTLDGASPGVWVHLDELREIKNLVFFSSLTEAALERYR